MNFTVLNNSIYGDENCLCCVLYTSHSPGTLTLGHLGLSSQAFTASSSAAWCCPSLRSAAERLLYRMQFCGSACRALVYKWTAAWKSPRWHASLLCCTFSMNSALLRPHRPPPSPETHRAGLPAVRELKTENWGHRHRSERAMLNAQQEVKYTVHRPTVSQRGFWHLAAAKLFLILLLCLAIYAEPFSQKTMMKCARKYSICKIIKQFKAGVFNAWKEQLW